MNINDKNLVLAKIKGKESALIDEYLLNGPESCMAKFDLSDLEWQVVFDHLIFYQNLIYKCVIRNSDFFVDEYVRNGISHVRDLLNVSDDKYDAMFKVVFDYIAIAKEGLSLHVLHFRDRYAVALKKHGSEFVRKVLGINSAKYEENWRAVLDVLLNTVCDDIFCERNFDEGLRAFSLMMNSTRTARRINKEGLI